MSSSLGVAVQKSRWLAPRLCVRRPILFARVDFGQGISGVILNLSEGGLCLQAERQLPPNGPQQLRLQKRHTEGWIEARGTIVWRSEADLIAGVNFLNLSGSARQEVREWLDFGARLEELRSKWTTVISTHRRSPHWLDLFEAEPSSATDVKVQESTGDQFQSESSVEKKLPAPPANGAYAPLEQLRANIASHPRSSKWGPLEDREKSSRLWLVVAATMLAIVLCGTVGWPLHYAGGFRAIRNSRSTEWASLTERQHAYASSVAAPAAKTISDSLAAFAAVAATPHFPTPALDTSGALPGATAPTNSFLQVAALGSQENAEQLMRTLQQKHLMAFVYQRRGGDLFKVFVGPFGDAQSLALAKSALRKEGLETIAKQSPN